MKLKYLTISIGLMSTLVIATAALAAQGNQNVIKPAIFPVSPTTPPPVVPTQFDVVGYIQEAVVDAIGGPVFARIPVTLIRVSGGAG